MTSPAISSCLRLIRPGALCPAAVDAVWLAAPLPEPLLQPCPQGIHALLRPGDRHRLHVLGQLKAHILVYPALDLAVSGLGRSAGAGSGRSRWSRDRPRPSAESEMSKKKTHRPCSHLPFRLHITYRIPDPADAVKPPARPLQGGSFLPAGAPFRQQETQIVCFFHSPGV